MGGTFDPPHRGHVKLAEMAQRRLDLQRVLLAPAGVQPLKIEEPAGASWPQRLQMVRLAVAGKQGLEASEIDAPRADGKPNYSVDAIARVREFYPEAELFFVLGADAFAGFRRWKQPEALLQMCELIVASRPGNELPSEGNDLVGWMPEGARFLGLEETKASSGPAEARVFLCGNAMARVYLLEDLAEDIAATELREQLARGEGFDWLPGGEHGAVADYIREKKLYR